MRPQWFNLPLELAGVPADDGMSPIPYEKMWESDYLWLPLVLQDRPFIARADYFRKDGADRLQKWWIGTLKAVHN